MVVDPFKALEPGAPVLRTDKPGKTDNRIFHWRLVTRPPPTEPSETRQ